MSFNEDGDWVLYENMEDFKEQFCDWIDAIIDEGYTEDSKILAMKRDGSIFFNFRDIVLRHPDNETIQDLFIEIENIERPEWWLREENMKNLYTFELTVMIEQNPSTNIKNLTAHIEKLFNNNSLRQVKMVQFKKSK